VKEKLLIFLMTIKTSFNNNFKIIISVIIVKKLYVFNNDDRQLSSYRWENNYYHMLKIWQ